MYREGRRGYNRREKLPPNTEAKPQIPRRGGMSVQRGEKGL